MLHHINQLPRPVIKQTQRGLIQYILLHDVLGITSKTNFKCGVTISYQEGKELVNKRPIITTGLFLAMPRKNLYQIRCKENALVVGVWLVSTKNGQQQDFYCKKYKESAKQQQSFPDCFPSSPLSLFLFLPQFSFMSFSLFSASNLITVSCPLLSQSFAPHHTSCSLTYFPPNTHTLPLSCFLFCLKIVINLRNHSIFPLPSDSFLLSWVN